MMGFKTCVKMLRLDRTCGEERLRETIEQLKCTIQEQEVELEVRNQIHVAKWQSYNLLLHNLQHHALMTSPVNNATDETCKRLKASEDVIQRHLFESKIPQPNSPTPLVFAYPLCRDSPTSNTRAAPSPSHQRSFSSALITLPGKIPLRSNLNVNVVRHLRKRLQDILSMPPTPKKKPTQFGEHDTVTSKRDGLLLVIFKLHCP